jgi:hypothetical protein
MSSIVVVALPEADEPVWDLSSEKKPHLTLLHMEGPLGDLESTVQFVRHAAETSLSRFGLSVDRRGTLGEKDADVLFFDSEYGVRQLMDFRAQLLKNDDIAKTYVKSEQFPGWIPHLTMGYPDAPAKEPENRYDLGWINFDRIAIWTSDFEGPEFDLPRDTRFLVDSPEAYHSLMHSGLEMNWSEKAGVHICQYGRQGMKWGVRRPKGPDGLVKGPAPAKTSGKDTVDKALDDLTTGKKAKPSADHKTMVKNLEKSVDTLSTKDLKDITTRIKAINDFSATTQAQKDAKASLATKLTKWALDNVKTGANKAGSDWIQEVTGDTLKNLLPDTPTGAAKKAKDKRDAEDRAQKQEDREAKKVKDAADAAKRADETREPQNRDEAINDLVYTITNLPKKKGD